ncbi:MAG TPA: pyridoxal-phosphate dependent enzyme [Clostridiales bacterium]|nr:pyridoxal-phosphate dependent enzyme [Clostridiales bacterium]
MQRIGEYLNGNAFFIKRDDLIPISFGGNKARKAVLFFNDIRSKGCDSVITYGSSSSNHCRIISNIAASEGLPCYIISPLENSRQTSNSKMTEIFGAKVIRCPISEVKDTISNHIEILKTRGNNPYFIQGGGHGNLGTQAYVDAYNEIKDYEDDAGFHFDYIFFASGTGTTQAGLVCGQIINGDDRKIVGISISRRNPFGKQVVFNSVNDYLSSKGMGEVKIDDVCFIDDYVLDGYGSYSPAILKTIKRILIQDGIPLDTTYTGKAFWGMKEYIKKNEISGKNILFIHTGGVPLFFDDLEEITKE